MFQTGMICLFYHWIFVFKYSLRTVHQSALGSCSHLKASIAEPEQKHLTCSNYVFDILQQHSWLWLMVWWFQTAWNIQSEWQISMQTYQPKKPAGFFPPYSLSNHYPICSFPLKASADLSEEPTIRLISFLASFTTLQSVRHGFGGSGRVETAPRRRKKNMSLKSGCF